MLFRSVLDVKYEVVNDIKKSVEKNSDYNFKVVDRKLIERTLGLMGMSIREFYKLNGLNKELVM